MFRCMDYNDAMSPSQRSASAEPQGSVHVLTRAFAVLDIITARQGECRLVDLGRELDLAKTTLHRLVTSLEAEQMVRFDPEGRLWLGARLMAMAGAANDGLVDRVRPLLERVAAETAETVDLSVLDGHHARFVDQIPSAHRLRAASSTGATFPLHCTANGKAMLALLDDDTAMPLASPLVRLTAATITTETALRRELAMGRASGLAFDRQEHTTGISAAGVAVRATNGQFVALSVPAPTERFDQSVGRITDALLSARAELAAILGAAA